MKNNPYLPVLLTLACLLTLVGVAAFLVSSFASHDDDTAALALNAGALAALTLPGGGLGFMFWLAASAIAWRPSDVPTPVSKEEWGNV